MGPWAFDLDAREAKQILSENCAPTYAATDTDLYFSCHYEPGLIRRKAL